MKGKKKKCLLTILGVVLALLLAGGGVLLWQRWTPAQIGDRYQLEDLEPNQAVLALRVRGLSNSYIVVDSQGRWKHVTPLEEWDDETKRWFHQHDHYPRVELYDLLLENDKFPYGKGRVPRKLLEWAVNMESAARKRNPEEDKRTVGWSHITSIYEYWVVAGVGENRKEVLLRRERTNSYAMKVTAWSDDIRVVLMCDKLDLLRGRESTIRKKHFFIGLGIAFVLPLALIGGIWLWQRRVKRNQAVSDRISTD